MSRFLSGKRINQQPYVPGEQPKDMKYIKLNTNESPYPPSQRVVEAAAREAGKLQLYSDPDCTPIIKKLAELYRVDSSRVIATNGSDETLNLAFMAFADEEHPLAFPDITYGFYPIIAELNHIPYTQLPLKDDFTVNIDDYLNLNRTIVIANPNAPTGIALSIDEIERILKGNPDNVVIIDEAYVDFGAQSAVSLTDRYDNLLVVQTFSKSRSMAGARLGFGIGDAGLISDLNTLRNSMNPYNVNRMTMMAGCAALDDNDYYMNNCAEIIRTRAWTAQKLKELGFKVLDSSANFVFAAHDRMGGSELYQKLKQRGILVRYFSKERITPFVRITIGTPEQMRILTDTVSAILKEA